MLIKAIVLVISLITIAMGVVFSPKNDTKRNKKLPKLSYKNPEELYKNLHANRGSENFTKEEWQKISKFSYKNREEFYKQLNITRRSENSTRKTWFFKDYVMKFNPNVVFDRLKKKKNALGKNASIVEDFEELFDEMDITDHLLQLNINKTLPGSGRRWYGTTTTTTEPPLPRWSPPGRPVRGNWNRDMFSLRMRMFHLIQHAIYQTRNRMVIMQILREKYRKHVLYKMGFLFSRVDVGCKDFHAFAYRSIHPCYLRYKNGVTKYEIISMLHAEERLNNKWFEIELLIDLIEQNDKAAKEILRQKDDNRTNEFAHAFVD